MQRKFRFSPIKTQDQLLEAIKYIHFQSFRMCKKYMGEILPVAGNVGIFCHFDDEFKFLTKMRERLTIASDNWNKKYFRLKKSIVIPAKGNIPETTYTYLYIRKPDDDHQQVGDLDFRLDPKKYDELKKALRDGKTIPGVTIMDRPDLELLRLSDPKIDVEAFVGKKRMSENVITRERKP